MKKISKKPTRHVGTVADRSWSKYKEPNYHIGSVTIGVNGPDVCYVRRNSIASYQSTSRIYSDEVPMADLREFRINRIPVGVLINQGLVENGRLV